MNRLEEYHKLVHDTVKGITWIGTQISDDKQNVEIRIVFGNSSITIPIKFEDIEKNIHSCKGFLDLIQSPLETVLTPYIREGQKCNEKMFIS